MKRDSVEDIYSARRVLADWEAKDESQQHLAPTERDWIDRYNARLSIIAESMRATKRGMEDAYNQGRRGETPDTYSHDNTLTA